MFVPRYSIRSIFWIMAGFAVLFLLVGLGVRGHAWAAAAAAGMGSLLLVAVVHAALFSLCWIVAGRFPARAPAHSRNPGPAATGSSGAESTPSPNGSEPPAGKNLS